MAPKNVKTPRTLRGKSSLETKVGRRENKKPAPPLKDRTSAQGKGAQQCALVMEKALGNAALVPAMFKQIGKAKRTPPQKELCNDQAGPLEDNGNQTLATGKVARGMDSLDETGTTLKNNGREGGPSWDGDTTDTRLLREGVTELRGTSSTAVTCGLTKNETPLQEIEDAQKTPPIFELKALSGKEDKRMGAKSDCGQADTAESFLSLSDQSKDLDDEIPLTDIDSECSSPASIWGRTN
ncbi:hypothetical protein NDU88_008781 [Pleurodeles waltl]|uniref:Uncharacterized protein n=1 Tax=Pleurodeles waltl TaxID=8319 RepID=A0AAV7RWR2_PLEWA|nr:hypothetical protein NDU88_008781 [Pleurodeles waltl]